MDPDKIEIKAFDLRDPAYRWKLWKKLDSREGGFHHFYWRRICIALAGLFLAGWFLATGVAWANVRYGRGFTEAGYLDLVAPWRWSRYRAAMGAHYLAIGRSRLERGDPYEALTYLNASLAIMPDSLESRRLAASAQNRLGFKAAALAGLREGMTLAAGAGDEAYLRAFFDAAFEMQADDEAFTVGRQLLPSRPDGMKNHRSIAFQMATARYNRGHYLEAEQILADWRLQELPEGEILLAFCYAESGMRGIAIGRLEGDLTRFEQRDGIYGALERLARDEGRPQEVFRYALLRELGESTVPQARIDLIYAYQALGKSAEAQREINSYCSDFKFDADALTMLAQFGADTGVPDAAVRARDLARSSGFPTLDFDLRVAQASIVARDYRRALQAVTAAQTEGQSMGRGYEATLAGIKAVALFGAGKSAAKIAFSDLLSRSGALSPAAGLFLADHLHQAGFAEQSRQLLEKICAENPDDQPALTELVRSDAAAGSRTELIADLPRILSMRKPAHDALEASLPSLDPAKDAALRAQVAKALAEGPPPPRAR